MTFLDPLLIQLMYSLHWTAQLVLEGYAFQCANAFMRGGPTKIATETENGIYPGSLGLVCSKRPSSLPPASLEGHTDRSERRNFTEIRYSLFKNNGGKRRVKSRRKVTERLLSMTGGLKGRISMPPPRVWTKHWKQGPLPQRAEDVGTHSSQHLKIHPWEKLNCKLSNFLPVGNQRGKKKKALWMP